MMRRVLLALLLMTGAAHAELSPETMQGTNASSAIIYPTGSNVPVLLSTIGANAGPLSLNISQSPNNGAVVVGQGADAIAFPQGDYYTVAIGPLVFQSKTITGGEDVGVGWGTYRNLTTGQFDTGVGHNAGGNITTESGDTLVGDDAMRTSTGANNTCVGSGACKYGTFLSVVAVGNGALDSNQQSSATANATQSVFVGLQSGGSSNLATITYDNAVGAFSANALTSGSQNNCFGWSACGALTTHGGNVMIGHQAGTLADASNETLVGSLAGSTITSGVSNICIGENACGTTLVTGANNIIIGVGADTLATGTSNEINIGGLLFFNTASLAAPVPLGGTSPSIDAHANNRSGTVTVGGGTVASATITFAGTGYTTWNHCRVTSESSEAVFAYSYTLTVITVTATSLTGDKIDYDCDGV